MRGHLITHLVESALKGVQTLHCIITPFFLQLSVGKHLLIDISIIFWLVAGVEVHRCASNILYCLAKVGYKEGM